MLRVPTFFQPLCSSAGSISATLRQPSVFTAPLRCFSRFVSVFRTKILIQPPSSSPCLSGLLGVAGLGFSSLLFLQTRTAFCQEFDEKKKNRVQAFRDAQKAIQIGVENAQFDWRLFWAFLRPDIWLIIGAIACSVCLAIINTEIPSLLGRLVNVIAQEAPKRPKEFAKLVRNPVSKLFGIYVLHAGFTFVNISLLFTLGERLAARIRLALFSNLLRQDIAFFDSHKTGELINRLTVDVQELKSNFKHVFVNGFRTVLQIIGGAVSLFWISPQMAALLLIGLPAMAGLGNKLGESLRTVSKEAQAQAAHATDVAEEALSNVRTVRGFAAEDTEIHLYNDEVQKFVRLNSNLGIGIGIFQALSNLAVNGAVIGVIYVGGSFLAEGKLLPGDLMSFMVTSQAIQRSIANLSMLYGQVVNGMSSGARVFEFIKLKPTVSLIGGLKIPYHSLKGSIELQHVGFSYPTRKDTTILNDLNLQIPDGHVVALCGPSGSGKSTIAALLERFYDPIQGRITLDGVDIRQLDPSWLRGRVIGYISQEPTLFATSIIENIRYGRPDATDAEVHEAAKAANAHDFITEFPKGYQTVLGERGVTVSGGQKQRIAIARALLKNPSILILDEATSALDSESEKFVQDALDLAAKGRTVLVIAHRLSTIQNATAIALIVNGKIHEYGSHQKLMEKRGLYWQFVQHQSVNR